MRIYKIVLIISVIPFISGCDKMIVKDTSGIKEMIYTRNDAQSLKNKTNNDPKLDSMYSKVCTSNNSWIDGLKFDLQTKEIFSVSAADYKDSEFSKEADLYITNAKNATVAVAPLYPAPQSNMPNNQQDKLSAISAIVAPPPPLQSNNMSYDIGIAVAIFANTIINNILDQNKIEIDQARNKIYEELEKIKWENCN